MHFAIPFFGHYHIFTSMGYGSFFFYTKLQVDIKNWDIRTKINFLTDCPKKILFLGGKNLQKSLSNHHMTSKKPPLLDSRFGTIGTEIHFPSDCPTKKPFLGGKNPRKPYTKQENDNRDPHNWVIWVRFFLY